MGETVQLGGNLWRPVLASRYRKGPEFWHVALTELGFMCRKVKTATPPRQYQLQVYGDREDQMRAMSWVPRHETPVASWWREDPHTAQIVAAKLQAELAAVQVPDFTCHCGTVLPYNPNLPGYWCPNGCGYVKNYRQGVRPKKEEAAEK